MKSRKEKKVEWISTWIQGIIVAVMISTIIEMILPEGNCKKYIKVVIGVYILASIISPVVTKITGSKFEFSNFFDIEEYVQASSPNSYEELSKSQEEQINGIYQTTLKNDMKQKIEAKGYQVSNIMLDISKNGDYTLEAVELILLKKEQETIEASQEHEQVESSKKKESTQNTITKIEQIQKVKVEVGENKKNSNKEEQKEQEITLTAKEQKELKQYLSSIYEIAESKIKIN